MVRESIREIAREGITDEGNGIDRDGHVLRLGALVAETGDEGRIEVYKG